MAQTKVKPPPPNAVGFSPFPKKEATHTGNIPNFLLQMPLWRKKKLKFSFTTSQRTFVLNR